MPEKMHFAFFLEQFVANPPLRVTTCCVSRQHVVTMVTNCTRQKAEFCCRNRRESGLNSGDAKADSECLIGGEEWGLLGERYGEGTRPLSSKKIQFFAGNGMLVNSDRSFLKTWGGAEICIILQILGDSSVPLTPTIYVSVTQCDCACGL